MVDPRLMQVIALTESNGIATSVRFEPAVYAEREAAAAVLPGTFQCKAANAFETWATATAFCSCSWGKYQIMGYQLYSNGLAMGLLQYLTDVAAQDASYIAYLTANGLATITLDQIISDPIVRERFITRWNGPGAVDAYWGMMQQRITQLGFDKAAT